MSAAVQLSLIPTTDQRTELRRVTATIGRTVMDFCRVVERRQSREFHAQELRDYVAAQGLTAPASPDRILRALRQRGKLHYVVVTRAKSLYRVTEVR